MEERRHGGGTVLVKDVYAGSYKSVAAHLTNVGGTLFFRALDGVHGHELWKRDGSSTGTVLVKDIYVGTSSSGAAAVPCRPRPSRRT